MSFDFCPTLAQMLAANRTVGETGRVLSPLLALSTPNNLFVLREMIRRHRPKRTLEVGMSYGGSCLAVTATHRDVGHAPQRQHVALDPFQKSAWDNSGLLAIERAGLTGYLDFRAELSSLELPRMLGLEARYDLIYVDGSHFFDDVFVDAYYAARLLSQGGIVVFDDSTIADVSSVLRFIRSNVPGLAEVDVGPYRMDAGNSLSYRAARAFRKTQLTAFRRLGDIERKWGSIFKRF